ncbi:hypothetical protein [Candidatus Amarolinea dominans]|uniref:hypothetical protein n=1 Tax=Candidatus Amarolinea dominans TaxID=3140696 RepID=UPI0031CC69C6
MGKLIYDGPLSTIRDRFGKFRVITFEMVADVGPLTALPGAEVMPVPADDAAVGRKPGAAL